MLLSHAHAPKNNEAMFLRLYSTDESISEDNDSQSKLKYSISDLLSRQIAMDQCFKFTSNCRPYLTPEMHHWLTSRLSHVHPEFLYLARSRLKELIMRQCDWLAGWPETEIDMTPEYVAFLDRCEVQSRVNSRKALLLLAEASTPRDAIGTSLATKLTNTNDSETHMLFHNTSLDYDSRDVRMFLIRLLHAFKHPIKLDNLPLTTDQLASQAAFYLEKGRFKGWSTLEIVVLGADQFTGDKYASDALSWIPHKLAPNVILILSMSPSSHQYKNLQRRDNRPACLSLSEASQPELHGFRLLFKSIRSQDTDWFDIEHQNVGKMNEEVPNVSLKDLSDTVKEHDLSFWAQNWTELNARTESISCLKLFLDRLWMLTKDSTTAFPPSHLHLTRWILCLLVTSRGGLFLSEVVHMVAAINTEQPASSDATIFAHHQTKDQDKDIDEVVEKDQIEENEKDHKKEMASSKASTSATSDWPHSLSLSTNQNGVILRPYVIQCLKSLSHCALVTTTPLRYRGDVWVTLSHPFVADRVQESRIYAETETSRLLWSERVVSHFLWSTSDIDRQMEELPDLLVTTKRPDLVTTFLSRLPVVRRLFVFTSISLQLLFLWRQALGHSTDYKDMVTLYAGDIAQRELALIDNPIHRHQARINVLMIARICMQSGNYSEAKDLARSLLKNFEWNDDADEYLWSDTRDLDFLSDVYFLLFEIMDERLKIFDFVSHQHHHLLKRALHYGSRALLLCQSARHSPAPTSAAFPSTHTHKTSSGAHNPPPLGPGDVSCDYLTVDSDLSRDICRYEADDEDIDYLSSWSDSYQVETPLGSGGAIRSRVLWSQKMSLFLMRLAFALDGWEQCSVSRIYSGSTIRKAAYRMLTRALKTFKRTKDRQMLAEAKMTRGVIEPRDMTAHKTKIYKVPLREARVFFGDQHILISRLYINIGICHEEADRFVTAFQYFTKWSQFTDLLLGANHPKTRRTLGVFNEARYQRVAAFVRSLNGQPVTEEVEREFLVFEMTLNEEQEVRASGDATHNSWGSTNHAATSSRSGADGDSGLSEENAIAAAEDATQETEQRCSDDETPGFAGPFTRVIEMYLTGDSSSQSSSSSCLQDNSELDFDGDSA